MPAIADAALLANQAEFDFEAGPYTNGEFAVVAFEADESISRTYRLDVSLAAEAADNVDVASLVGQKALLTIHLGDGSARFIHGLIVRISHWDEGTNTTHKRYRATIVPQLWTLRHTRNSRIFQEQTVPQIVKKVLDEHKVEQRWDLSSAYRAREFCVQYRESDLDFVCRLLEEEGIYFFFEHQEDKHTLVMGDAPSALQPIAGEASVGFVPPASLVAETEYVSEIATRLELQPGAVALSDYNFFRPSQKLGASSEASNADASLEIYDYPGRYDDPSAGRSLSQIRLEELRARTNTANGTGIVRRFVSGATFELADHPDSALNKRYLLTSVRHSGQQKEQHSSGEVTPLHGGKKPEPSYRNTFTCIAADIPYRPERLTPRPLIPGAQTAIVVGPGGEEIHTDEHGRIKVHFHWDRTGANDRSSCWIRVGQSWAGPGWGALYIPRIGHEVIVEFLEGDPDRPIVTGSVYNGNNPTPIELPGEKTKSTLRSASSPGENGANELRFEDAAGSEEVYLHAQKDLTIAVENDKNQTVGGNETLLVKKDRSRTIDGNQVLEVKKNDTSTINGNQSLEVVGNRSTTVTGNHTETITGSQTIQVSSSQSINVTAAVTETIGGGRVLTIGGGYQISVGGAMNEVVGGVKAEQVAGAKVETVGAKKTETVAGSRNLKVGGDMSEQVGKSRSLKVTKDMLVTVEGKHSHTVKDAYSLTAKEISLEAEEGFTVKVGQATLQIKKSGDVVLKGAKIELTASGDVIIKGSKISEN